MMNKPQNIDFMLAKFVWEPLRRLDEYITDYKKLKATNRKAVEKFCKKWKMRVPLDPKLDYEGLKRKYRKDYKKDEISGIDSLEKYLCYIILGDEFYNRLAVDTSESYYIRREKDGTYSLVTQTVKTLGEDFSDEETSILEGILNLTINLNFNKAVIRRELLKQVDQLKNWYDKLTPEMKAGTAPIKSDKQTDPLRQLMLNLLDVVIGSVDDELPPPSLMEINDYEATFDPCFDQYFKAWDLKYKKKMTLDNIAKQADFFPEEFEEPDPFSDDESAPEQNPESARQKVHNRIKAADKIMGIIRKHYHLSK